MDLVSVIVPTYNRNDLLFGRCLPSILRQTHANLDVHVVADGMLEDAFDDLLQRGKALADPRITYWNIPRPTYPKDEETKWCVLALWALNYGLDRAKGDWVSVLADDDEWTDDCIEVLLREAKDKGVDFAYGQAMATWANGEKQMYGRWPPGRFQFVDGCYVYRNGMGYRYDPDCVKRGLPEDGDLWDRMVAGGVTFTFVKQIVHHYYPNRQKS